MPTRISAGIGGHPQQDDLHYMYYSSAKENLQEQQCLKTKATITLIQFAYKLF